MADVKLKYGKDGFSINKAYGDLSKLTEDELRELKAQGKIVYKPARSKDGKKERTLDGQIYTVGAKGQRQRATPKDKLSKKQRRKLRQALKEVGMETAASRV